MNRVIILHWKPADCRAIVLRGSSSKLEVESVTQLDPSASSAELGQQLGSAVAGYSPQRAKVIVAVGRDSLDWQHLQLPPCPDEELPQLVRLQSDYTSNGVGDASGLDFLTLEGGSEEPRQVWSIALAPSQLTKVKQVLSAADLSADHVIPAVLGWPVYADGQAIPESAQLCVGPLGNEPAIWYQVDNQVVLFRQLQLPASDSPDFSAAVATQLKRTEIALSQRFPKIDNTTTYLIGSASQQLTALGTKLSAQLNSHIEIPASPFEVVQAASSPAVEEPILALASAALAGESPLVDLINPHAPPAPATRLQTYYLAAAAALALFALVGWQAYRNVQEPLERAAEMQAEIDLYEESADELRQAEGEVASIRAWLDSSVNLLSEMRLIAKHVRSEPLDSESFDVEDDIVVGKIEMRNRQFTIEAYAKDTSDLQPVEYRLRDGKHRVRRGETSRAEEVNGYPVKFTAIVDVTDGTQVEGGEL